MFKPKFSCGWKKGGILNFKMNVICPGSHSYCKALKNDLKQLLYQIIGMVKHSPPYNLEKKAATSRYRSQPLAFGFR